LKLSEEHRRKREKLTFLNLGCSEAKQLAASFFSVLSPNSRPAGARDSGAVIRMSLEVEVSCLTMLRSRSLEAEREA